MAARLLAGFALIAAGVLGVRFRAAIARSRAESERDHLRYSLLNEERVEREREAWRSPDALRTTRWGAAATGIALIAMGGYVVMDALV